MNENEPTRAKFRLAAHQAAVGTAFALTKGQFEVSQLELASSKLVYGSPASGKSAAVRALALNLARKHGAAAVLVVAASRESATLMRDQLALEFQGSTPGAMARTISSLAFSILRQAALDQGLATPELISGPEQDRILKSILEPFAAARGEAFAGAEFEVRNRSLAELGFPKFITPQVVGLRGFRAELRDLIAVAQENQISPQELGSLGQQFELAVWAGTAKLYEAYLERLREPAFLNRHDSATLLNEAARFLLTLPEGQPLPAAVANLKTVIVDDAQELTPGAIRLLQALAGLQVGLVLVGDPDASVLGFRASDPRAMRDLAAQIGASANPITLNDPMSSRAEDLSSAMLRVAGRISTELAGPQRAGLASNAAKTPPADSKEESDSGNSAISVRIHDTPASESAWLAKQLRSLHLHEGFAWQRIAVVGRSRDVLRQFEAELAAENIPVLLHGSRAALRDEFASRELLQLLRFVLQEQQPTIDEAVAFLTGPYCGLDSLAMRRLRRFLRRQELEAEGNRTADELIIEAFSVPGAAVTLKTPEGFRLADFVKGIWQTRELAANGATVDQLLWNLWSVARAKKEWVVLSRGLGEVATQANRNLDAVVALFSVANRFVERNPEGAAKDFVDFQLDLELAEDTLSLNYRDDDRIQLLTPAGLLGREFDVVVLVGMQEGIWPNLKARSSLLRASGLAEFCSGRSDSPAGSSRSEIFDELRMLYKTLGAARQRIVLSAVESEELQVSPFVELIAGDLPAAIGFNEPALSLRAKVGELRRQLQITKSVRDRQELLQALKLLAEQGVPGAAPAEWYGSKALSSTEPVTDLAAGELVYISPSQFENFLKCPLHWFMSSHGGREGGFEASLGTLLHKVLEEAADESETALNLAVESKWHTLDFESEWVERNQRRKATQMVKWLAEYLVTKKLENIEAIAREQKVKAVIGQAKISGNIDRIERSASGEIRIVDLKTGSHAPTVKTMDTENAQLALYQLAYQHGGAVAIPGVQEGDRLIGATLIFPGLGKTFDQKTLDPELNPGLQAQWLGKVEAAVRGMAMADGAFIANVASHCHSEQEFGECEIYLTKAVSHAG